MKTIGERVDDLVEKHVRQQIDRDMRSLRLDAHLLADGEGEMFLAVTLDDPQSVGGAAQVKFRSVSVRKLLATMTFEARHNPTALADGIKLLRTELDRLERLYAPRAKT